MALTEEVDDAFAGASELTSRTLEKLELRTNSLALLFSDPDASHRELLAAIRSKINIPVVGVSAMSMISSERGLVDMAAIMVTLTSDDVSFSVAHTDPITRENASEQLRGAYGRALDALAGSRPVMAILFPPYIRDVMLDTYPRELERASGGLPIFGGVPSCDGRYGHAAIYCGDAVYNNRACLVLIGGEAKPVFTVKNRLGLLVDIKRTVTSSKENIIYRVGDQTFVEFLTQLGLDVKRIAAASDASESFNAYPLLVKMPDDESDDDLSIIRAVNGVDLETGAGIAIGEVPEGSIISPGIVKLDDIRRTAQSNISELIDKMKENETRGYEYSQFFAISCLGRYYALGGKKSSEAAVLLEGLPPGVPMVGFYGYGEICPKSVKNSRAANAAHNESIAIMAI
jgi:hypothetical protein